MNDDSCTEVLADWRYVGLGMMVGQTYPAAASTALSYGTSSTTAANAYTGFHSPQRKSADDHHPFHFAS